MRTNSSRPLILPIELQSKSSESTDIDAFSFQRRFQREFVSPFSRGHGMNFNMQSSLFMRSEGYIKPKPIRKPTANFKNMEIFSKQNDHLLQIQGFGKHNKYGVQTKPKIFKMRCKKNCLHTVEVSPLNDNEILIKFLDDHSRDPQIHVNSSHMKQDNIIVEFFKFCNSFKDINKVTYLFSGFLNKRNKFQCHINYENIRNLMMDFFKNKPLINSDYQLNDFEYLFFGIFILKKKFNNWSIDSFDLDKLQKSDTKKRKEHFLKFILKKLFKYLNLKNLHFFGEKNKEIIERMKMIFFEGTKRNGKRDPNSNRMENLGKILSSNKKFKEFYDKSDIDEIIEILFKEYSKKPMDTLINNHIYRLRSQMERESDPKKKINSFVKMIFDLKKKKLKNMWTFAEFKQAQNVLNYIMTSN
jgi:hypothetical protein